MSEFNLIDEPWILCIDLAGRQVEYGIRDTLAKAHELREICDDSPLVTVAIHRLLLAILYRAFQGPTGMKEWKALFQAGHSGDNLQIERSYQQIARQLIACQQFALGFGKSGYATINGLAEELPYSADAIALRGVSVWLQGNSVFQTLMFNAPFVEKSSEPPWELDDSNKYRDRMDGKNRKTVSATSVVDRYTWQSRLVRLLPDNSKVSRIFFTQGRSSDKSVGDPMKVYRASKEEGVAARSLSNSKAAWRDAHTILMIPPSGSNERRPDSFNLVARARSEDSLLNDITMNIHIVGLASAANKAGKFLLWRHERMPVPAALLSNVDLIDRLGSLIENAENAAKELNSRTRRIAKLHLAPTSESPDGRQPDKDDITRLAESLDPRPAYWSRLEQHFYTLLENLPDDWDAAQGNWKPDGQQIATNGWREHIKREARRALEESVRSLGTTARAIQAVARVRTDFNDDDLKPKQKKDNKSKRGRKRK